MSIGSRTSRKHRVPDSEEAKPGTGPALAPHPVGEVAQRVGERWEGIPWQDAPTAAEREALRAAAGHVPEAKTRSRVGGAWLNRILAGPPGPLAGFLKSIRRP